jgi:hypothetical protein
MHLPACSMAHRVQLRRPLSWRLQWPWPTCPSLPHPPRAQVARKTVDACRPYLELPHFNREVIFNKSRAAAGLCEFAINIIKYYDVVSEVEPKRQELAAANAKLTEANTILAAVQAKVRHTRGRLRSC